MILLGNAIVFATHNAGKLAEARRMLAPLGVAVRSAGDLGVQLPPETAGSFEGNAWLKAEAASRMAGMPVLADDSGLCVPLLGGAPGVATAALAETANGRDDSAGMRLLAASITAAGGRFPVAASFVCFLLLLLPGNVVLRARGEVWGSLCWPPRGSEGHGFDPMFIPSAAALTFGEMSLEEKEAFSHRGRAFRALCASCFT